MRKDNRQQANRHGIPLRGGDPPRKHTCIWPACMDEVGDYRKTRMCNEHARLVYREVEDARRFFQNTEEYLAKPLPKPSEPREEVIYYIEYPDEIKVGWTNSLERRLKRFKPGGKLLAVHPGTRSDEAKLHKRFAAYRTHGNEWYGKLPSLLHHIELVRKEHGEPPKMVVGPKPVTVPEPRDPQYVAGKRIIKPGPVIYGKYR